MPPSTEVPSEMNPSRYIEKVSLVTGEVLDQEILPKQLLVGNHRDYHILDVHAQYMMSKVVKVTGSEEEARRRMKERRRLGHRASRVVARAIGEEDVTKVSEVTLRPEREGVLLSLQETALRPCGSKAASCRDEG